MGNVGALVFRPLPTQEAKSQTISDPNFDFDHSSLIRFFNSDSCGTLNLMKMQCKTAKV